jgi:hypothetical protein
MPASFNCPSYCDDSLRAVMKNGSSSSTVMQLQEQEVLRTNRHEPLQSGNMAVLIEQQIAAGEIISNSDTCFVVSSVACPILSRNLCPPVACVL